MIKIKEKFKNLIPKLSDEELNTLEKSILEVGITTDIQIWNEYIVDGHNRYSIAQKHNIPFNTKELEFDTEDDVILYIIDNQLGRRNITSFVRLELLEEYEKVLKEKAKENLVKAANKTNTPLPLVAKALDDEIDAFLDDDIPPKKEVEPIIKHNIEPINVREVIAKKAGVSNGIKSRYDFIKNKIDDDTKEKLRRNEITITKVHTEVKRKEKEQQKSQKVKEILNSDYNPIDGIKNIDCIEFIKSVEDNSIDCLLTDPPYGVNIQFNKYDNDYSRKIDNDNNTETALELLDELLLNIKPKLKSDAHLYIFCSWKVYPEFKNIVEKYYKIKNLIVWNKKLMGMGDLKYNYADTYELIIFAGGNREFKKRPSNIIDVRFNEERIHNTQKPVELLEQLINNSTDEGDVVCDPFLGSGSTAIAALNNKRKIIGSEIDNQNYKITIKRINENL